MEFTEKPLEPFGTTLLDMSIESNLSLKTALVFRIVKLLQSKGCLPAYGHHMAEVCLEEALVNAIVHGNKADASKKIRVIVFADEARFGVIVEDQGKGFTARDIPDSESPDAALREHGRGIMLMTHYMGEVKYTSRGNRLRLVRQKQISPDPGSREPVPVREAEPLPKSFDLAGIDLTIPEIKGAGLSPVIVPEEIELGLPAASASAPVPANAPAGKIAPGAKPPAGTPAAKPAAAPLPTGPRALVAVHERDGVTIARIQSERLTEDNAEEVRQGLYAAAAQGKALVVDLTEVSFMSSVGISTLIGTHKQAGARKVKMVLAGVGPGLRNVLKATGLLRLFQVESDQDTAVWKLTMG
ncbi:MAG: anti-sigma factor antagonist [Planctomycetota bacterium]|nr:anti-sigma factor antagonist [Planctomycetota bacterium]